MCINKCVPFSNEHFNLVLYGWKWSRWWVLIGFNFENDMENNVIATHQNLIKSNA